MTIATIFSRRMAATALCVAVLATAPAHAAFTSLTVFGDSLSDSGNNALVIGANGGQVITGNTYIPTQPYAFGGARTTASGAGPGGFPFSATAQLAQFLATPGALPASALFVIAVGGNDVRSTAEAVAANPANAGAIIGAGAASFATGVGAMVDSLQARGARNIVVWGAPDVGRSPFAIATNTVAGATFISSAFNSALASRLAGEAGVTPFDIASLVGNVASNPGAFGLTNVTDACGAVIGCNPSQYLFWDAIHPTSAGHALIASAMLAAVPEPASVVLMLGGLVAVVVRARRRAAARLHG